MKKEKGYWAFAGPNIKDVDGWLKAISYINFAKTGYAQGGKPATISSPSDSRNLIPKRYGYIPGGELYRETLDLGEDWIILGRDISFDIPDNVKTKSVPNHRVAIKQKDYFKLAGTSINDQFSIWLYNTTKLGEISTHGKIQKSKLCFEEVLFRYFQRCGLEKTKQYLNNFVFHDLKSCRRLYYRLEFKERHEIEKLFEDLNLLEEEKKEVNKQISNFRCYNVTWHLMRIANNILRNTQEMKTIERSARLSINKRDYLVEKLSPKNHVFEKTKRRYELKIEKIDERLDEQTDRLFKIEAENKLLNKQREHYKKLKEKYGNDVVVDCSFLTRRLNKINKKKMKDEKIIIKILNRVLRSGDYTIRL